MEAVLVKHWNDKGLSPASVKLYISCLRKINGGELKNLKFLNNPEAVISKLQETYKPNSVRSFLIAICSCLNVLQKSPSSKTLYKKYYDILVSMNSTLKAEEAKNEKTETQEKNWIDWSVVLEKREDLKKYSQEHPDDYNALLSLVVVSLYTCLPPRRNEYSKMDLVKSAKGLPTDRNYLDWDKKEFVFNSFKTAKNEGQVVIDVPEDLQEVLDIYISKHPLLKKGKLIKNTKIPFLVYDNSKPLDKINSITRILNKVLGRGVGSSMLRHSYLSNKYGDKLKEQQEDAKAMSHSIGQQKDYIKT